MEYQELERTIEVPSAYAPRYELADVELSSLTAQLLAEREPHTDQAVVCYRVENDSKYANVARTIERQVFEVYFGNTADDMMEEYGPYEEQSVFFLSVDKDKRNPVGVLRAIRNGSAGLKSLNDLEAFTGGDDRGALPRITIDGVQQFHNIDSLDKCWDVGTVAVTKPYRSDTLTSVQLYRALYVSALDNGVDYFVSIIDKKPYEKMTHYLGIPFVPLVGSEQFPYLGSSASQAVYGEVPEFYRKMNRKRFTLRGALARRALRPLVKGTLDDALHL